MVISTSRRSAWPAKLYIGRRGLARGYPRRGALYGDRFIPDPFGRPARGCTAPATWRDGARTACSTIIGRADHQVKIRGFRIELGEIIRARLQAQ